MELHTVLIMLSLLPLLEAQNPEHAINIGDPITNETLSWVSVCPGPGPVHCRILLFPLGFPFPGVCVQLWAPGTALPTCVYPGGIPLSPKAESSL
jgi:hypothetical protein